MLINFACFGTSRKVKRFGHVAHKKFFENRKKLLFIFYRVDIHLL